MFLGEKYYSDLDIVAFHPEKYEILVRTRDKEKNLVLFNYRSLLYKKIGSDMLAAAVSPDMNFIYALAERNKYFYFSEANLEIIQLSPYDRTQDRFPARPERHRRLLGSAPRSIFRPTTASC